MFASLDTAATQLLALGVTVFEVLPANYVRAAKVYRRGRPAALKALAKLQREGKPAKPKPAGFLAGLDECPDGWLFVLGTPQPPGAARRALALVV